jgi:hypothetical protein
MAAKDPDKGAIKAGWKSKREYDNFVRAYNEAYPEKPITGNKYVSVRRLFTPSNRQEVSARRNGWSSAAEYKEFKKGRGRLGVKQAFTAKQKAQEEYKNLPNIRGQESWTSASKEYKEYKKAVSEWKYNSGKYGIEKLDFLALSDPEQYQLHASIFDQFSTSLGVLEQPTKDVVLAFQKFFYVDILGQFTEEEWDDLGYGLSE